MKPQSRRGRMLLFGGAVVLPSAALIAATLGLGLQERELEAQRRAEQRGILAAALARELAAALDRVRSRVLQAAPDLAAMSAADPALVAVARSGQRGWRFLWEEPAARLPRLGGGQYSSLISAGEAAEFSRSDFAQAAGHYARAAATSPDSTTWAEAQLKEGRALAKAGNPEAAAKRYREIAAFPPAIRDAEGMPLALYAAEGLLDAGPNDPAAREALLRISQSRRSLDLSALTALNELVSRVDSVLGREISGWIRTVERLQGLARTLPALLARAPQDSASPTPWFPFGAGPWLVAAQPGSGEQPALALVVDPVQLLARLGAESGSLAAVARGIRLTSNSAPGSAELDPGLPGLRAVFTDSIALGPPQPGLARRLFLLVVPLVVGLTLVGAWLFWRDVRREVSSAKLRSQLVAGVSHELKTPLTSIRMFAETLLLRRPQSEAVRREYLETILHESERLTRHINNALDFSRIEAGQQQYSFAPADIGKVVQESAEALAYPLAQGGFDLVLTVPDPAPVLQADPEGLGRAVINLLTNAMKFSEQRRTIELSVASENGDVLVRVRDFGRGVAPEDQRRIFEPFYRAPETGNRTAGTGLGLQLVSHVVQAHGGRVEVESSLGQGSTFTIRLPRERTL